MFILRSEEDSGIILWVTPLSPRIQPMHQGGREMKTGKKDSATGAILLFLVVTMTVAAGLAPANAQTVESETWHYNWSSPTTGAAVDHYIVEVQQDGSVLLHRFVTPDDSRDYTFKAFYDHDYEVRVTAVDIAGRKGLPSEWSYRETCNRPPPNR